jgi:hypothetical protein
MKPEEVKLSQRVILPAKVIATGGGAHGEVVTVRFTDGREIQTDAGNLDSVETLAVEETPAAKGKGKGK